MLEIAVNTLLRVRKYLPLGKDYHELLDTHRDLYELAARVALNGGDIPRALAVLETLRASSAADRVRIAMARSHQVASTARSLEHLDQLRRRIWQLDADPSADLTASSRLVREHDELMAELFTETPGLASDLFTSRQLEGLGEAVRAGVNLLVYGVFETFSFVVVQIADSDELKCRRVELGAATIRRLVDEYRDRLFQMDGSHGDSVEDLVHLSKTLTGDCLSLFDRSRPLCVIPHGPMHDFPFSALRDSHGWLGEQVEIFSVPSIPLLRRRDRENRLTAKHVVALAYPGEPDSKDYLGGAVAELRNLHQVFPKATCLEGRAATPTALFRLAPGADVLHIACHAVLNAESPLLSCLILAADDESNGEATVSQLINLSLRASLVVLSGCQTARGQLTAWDDTVSLAEGCLQAGAQAALGALWYLSDQSTLKLVTRFYENIDAGMIFRQSLFDARRTLIQNGSKPYEWSPFTLIGFGPGDWRLGVASRLRLTVR